MKNTYASPVTTLVERAEALGWSCYVDPKNSSIEFSQDIPTGEDFSFCAYGNTVDEIVKSIREYADGFDTDEHVRMWLEAKENGVANVPSVAQLVADAEAIQEMLNTLAWDDELCSNQRVKIKDSFTLRNKIAEIKADFHEKGGRDEYWSETLVWEVQDYHSSKGSVLDFTEDDWRACKENGLSLSEVLALCDEEKFTPDVTTLEHFFSNFPEDMPKEDAIAAVEDFYTWRCDCLPVAEKVYNNG